MNNGINKNKTLFVLTILFCLILNGIRAQLLPVFESEHIKFEIGHQIQYQYRKNNISYIFSRVINKLPTFDNKIYGIEYLFQLVLRDKKKVFEFATQYKKYGLVANVKLPQCVEAVVFSSSNMCFDTGKMVLKPYSNKNATISLPYLLHEGNCQTEKPEDTFYWKVTSDKPDNIKNVQTLDGSRQLKNVKFELAPDRERCYIKVGDLYLSQDGTTEYLTLKDDKSPNAIWHVRSRSESWYLSKK